MAQLSDLGTQLSPKLLCCLPRTRSPGSGRLVRVGGMSFAMRAEKLWGKLCCSQGFPGGSVVKNPPASVGDAGSIPGSGRSPGEGNGSPLQYSRLGNPMDRGTWWAAVHRVSKSWTWLTTKQQQQCYSQLNIRIPPAVFKSSFVLLGPYQVNM